MKEAASLYVGTHNFQNFCKIDRSKENILFERTIHTSKVELVNYSQELSS